MGDDHGSFVPAGAVAFVVFEGPEGRWAGLSEQRADRTDELDQDLRRNGSANK